MMEKKLRNKSQYYPDLEYISPEFEFHSQIGSGYRLAQLGDLGEAYDRLAKYDIPDVELNFDIARRSIDYFMDQISPCAFVDFEDSFDSMDKRKAIGFGAQRNGIFSRSDPNMYDYLLNYVTLCKRQISHIIINASQKDEVRVEDKTPRLFMSFPPEHTFLATMILGEFLDQFVDNRFCTNLSVSTVGDSMQNGAGKLYFDKMDVKAYKYCTDTSAQDSSVSPVFINMVYDAIKLKYDLNEEEDMMFENVRFNSIYKMVNMNGHLYLVPRGLGSGDYLTIVINIMWRYYMFLESYNHDLDKVNSENVVIICGDDFACSSDYGDLNMNSKYAKIEWAGHPVTWEEMDFCSIRFSPYIHHDPNKVLAVLNNRKKRQHILSPESEMQRLGGLLRVLSDEKVYNEILRRMFLLTQKHPETLLSYRNLFISYDDLYQTYNTYIEN